MNKLPTISLNTQPEIQNSINFNVSRSEEKHLESMIDISIDISKIATEKLYFFISDAPPMPSDYNVVHFKKLIHLKDLNGMPTITLEERKLKDWSSANITIMCVQKETIDREVTIKVDALLSRIK
jgi:hypothetical protein